jgi:hypothetical protein
MATKDETDGNADRGSCYACSLDGPSFNEISVALLLRWILGVISGFQLGQEKSRALNSNLSWLAWSRVREGTDSRIYVCLRIESDLAQKGCRTGLNSGNGATLT